MLCTRTPAFDDWCLSTDTLLFTLTSLGMQKIPAPRWLQSSFLEQGAEQKTAVGSHLVQLSVIFSALPCNYIKLLPLLWPSLLKNKFDFQFFLSFTKDHFLHLIRCIGSNCYISVKVELAENLFKPKDSKLSATTNLQAIPQNLFSAEGARECPIWTVILQMLFQIFP